MVPEQRRQLMQPFSVNHQSEIYCKQKQNCKQTLRFKKKYFLQLLKTNFQPQTRNCPHAIFTTPIMSKEIKATTLCGHTFHNQYIQVYNVPSNNNLVDVEASPSSNPARIRSCRGRPVLPRRRAIQRTGMILRSNRQNHETKRLEQCLDTESVEDTSRSENVEGIGKHSSSY